MAGGVGAGQVGVEVGSGEACGDGVGDGGLADAALAHHHHHAGAGGSEVRDQGVDAGDARRIGSRWGDLKGGSVAGEGPQGREADEVVGDEGDGVGGDVGQVLGEPRHRLLLAPGEDGSDEVIGVG